MEFTVKSPANIAFIKYWGQKDIQLVIPCNDSFSMNLSECFTEINFKVLEDPSIKEMQIKEYKSSEYKQATDVELQKVLDFYVTLKKELSITKDIGFTILSSNSFPKKAGIASSASFFSAIALAFCHAFQKEISEKELSILARLSGSGSAARSIPDGFVWWHAGLTSESSYTESIGANDYWDISDVVLVLSSKEKKVSSQDGHKRAQTSPYFESRQQLLPKILSDIKAAFIKKDFTAFGRIVENEAINFHSVLMTQNPPLYFWSGKTLEAIEHVIKLRQDGTECYFTIDAGENVHVICQKDQVEVVRDSFLKTAFVEDIIVNYPSRGARIL